MKDIIEQAKKKGNEEECFSLMIAIFVFIFGVISTVLTNIYYEDNWLIVLMLSAMFVVHFFTIFSSEVESNKINQRRLRKYFSLNKKTNKEIESGMKFILYLHRFESNEGFFLKNEYQGPALSELVEINGRAKMITVQPENVLTYTSAIDELVEFGKYKKLSVVCLANVSDPLKDNPNVKYIIGNEVWKDEFIKLSRIASKIVYFIASDVHEASKSMKFELDYIQSNSCCNKTLIIIENNNNVSKLWPSIQTVNYRKGCFYNNLDFDSR